MLGSCVLCSEGLLSGLPVGTLLLLSRPHQLSLAPARYSFPLYFLSLFSPLHQQEEPHKVPCCIAFTPSTCSVFAHVDPSFSVTQAPPPGSGVSLCKHSRDERQSKMENPGPWPCTPGCYPDERIGKGNLLNCLLLALTLRHPQSCRASGSDAFSSLLNCSPYTDRFTTVCE